MPSATGKDWEKYKKFADEEEEEKKIVPLSEEYVIFTQVLSAWMGYDGIRWRRERRWKHHAD